jgi:hypothetical protein
VNKIRQGKIKSNLDRSGFFSYTGQGSREHKRDLYVDSSLAMQRIRHIEEEEEMNRISTGKMVKQRSLNRILKVIKNNGVAK